MKSLVRSLKKALHKLDQTNEDLLQNEVSEQCINHKFAEILNLTFRNKYYVDCEYNRNISEQDFKKYIDFRDSELKTFIKGYSAFSEEKKEKAKRRLARPDIILHRRNLVGGNFLIIETKRRNNPVSKAKEFDRLKLMKYTQGGGKFTYQFGVFIEYHDGVLANALGRNHTIEIYQHGKRVFPHAVPLEIEI